MAKAISLTPAELQALNPCGMTKRLALFGRRKSMTAKQAFAAGATIRELLWVAQRLGHKDKCVRFALACAQRVAHLNPDPRVQTCLDATGQYLEFPTDENLKALRISRYAAYADANAAANVDAAYYAVNAAYAAAAYYANAAADAAAAAAYYAAAAAYYAAANVDVDAAAYANAADARQKEIVAQQAIFVKIFSGEA